MTSPWSIAARLRWSLLAGLGLLWLCAAAFGALAVHDEINEVFDSALQETGQRLLALAADDLDEHPERSKHSIPHAERIGKHREYLIYQVRDAAGEVLLKSHDAPAAAFDAPLQTGFHDTAALRLFTQGTPDNDLFVQVAEASAHRSEALREALMRLLMPLFALLPAAALVIDWVVRKTLAPIGAVERQIALRGGADLSPISDQQVPAELQPITHNLNRLLQRLAAALETERAFAANSAHELRTPIAAALAQLQVLQTEIPDGPASQRLSDIAAILARLANIAEKLLQLAKAESGAALAIAAVDLATVARIVVDEFQRDSRHGRQIRLENDATGPLRVRGDLDAIGIALRNLIENAFAHGGAGVQIVVRLQAPDRVLVIDSGPGIAPEASEQLRQRFQRGTTAASGAGLGLSIVQTVMDKMGGTLRLYHADEQQQRRFVAELCFVPEAPAH
jgi:two-component system, OmpR family, sensor kinase